MNISEYFRAGISLVALVGIIGLSLVSTISLSPVGADPKSQVAGVSDSVKMQTYLRDLNLNQQDYSSLLVQDEGSAAYRLLNYQELSSGTALDWVSITNPTASVINIQFTLSQAGWNVASDSAISTPTNGVLAIAIPANTTVNLELVTSSVIPANQIQEVLITEVR